MIFSKLLLDMEDLIKDYSSGEDSLRISGSYNQNDFTFSYNSGHSSIYLGDDLLAIIQNSTLTVTDLNYLVVRI